MTGSNERRSYDALLLELEQREQQSEVRADQLERVSSPKKEALTQLKRHQRSYQPLVGTFVDHYQW